MDDLWPKCIACKSDCADDEYHWFEDGIEHIWQLCGGCCEFACEMVELFANIETEIGEWDGTRRLPE